MSMIIRRDDVRHVGDPRGLLRKRKAGHTRGEALRIKRLVGVVLGAALFMVTAVPTASAGTAVTASPAAGSLDRAALRTTLNAIHEAGMYGSYSSVREGTERWTGASGLADVDTGRPVGPGMRHRVGSISKTFTAVAILQQVERGRIRLDAPIGEYLPELRAVP